MSREAINNLRKKKVKRVEIDGEVFFMRMLTAGEAVAYNDVAESAPKSAPVDAMAKLLALALCHESGERLLGDAPDDFQLLTDMPFAYMTQLFEHASKVNKFDGASADAAQGNSPGAS